jgi:3',5'-cyclic AMP phosphodiesterase CpdA
MPGLFHEPISRKTFLSTAAKAAGAMALTSTTGRLLLGNEPTELVRVALLSDTHIPADPAGEYRGFRPVENLKQVVPQVVEAKPAAVIIDGDAARLAGLEGDYRALRELLAPIAAHSPVYVGLGNHDDRRNFFKVFPVGERQESLVAGKHVALIERGGVRLIVLDSLLYVDKVAGLLGKAQRTWLSAFLEEADDRPTVLFFHHTVGDGDGDLLDTDRLYRILEPYPQVKALFYGHSHRYALSQRENLHLINLPAVGYNFSEREPVGWVEATFSPTGVDMTLHAIGGNREGDGQTKSVSWA